MAPCPDNYSILGKKLYSLLEKLNEFNVFGNKITNIDDYTIQLTDTSKATITEPNTLKIVTKAHVILDNSNK